MVVASVVVLGSVVVEAGVVVLGRVVVVAGVVVLGRVVVVGKAVVVGGGVVIDVVTSQPLHVRAHAVPHTGIAQKLFASAN